MAEASIFPAFIRAEYDPASKGFPAFEREVDASLGRATKKTGQFAKEMTAQIATAMTNGTRGGRFDFGADQLRLTAQEAQAAATALRTVATSAAATEGATSGYSRAADLAAQKAEKHAKALNEQAIMLDRLQREANISAVGLKHHGDVLDRTALAAGRVERSFSSSRQASIQLGQQAQDFAIQIQGGQSALVAFSQQASQAAFVMSGMGGTMGRLGGFLAGPWGSAVFVGATAVTLLTTAFGKNKEEAEKARKAADEFRDGLLDMSKFADDTTGKMEKLADATVRAALAANQLKRNETGGQASDLEKRALQLARDYSRTQGQSFRQGSSPNNQFNQYRYDPDVDAALKKSGGNFIILEAEIAKLAKVRPELNGLARELSQLAAEGIEIGKARRKLAEDRKFLTGERQTYEGFKPPKGSTATPNGEVLDFIMPVQGRITSGFGSRTRPNAAASANHGGIDIAAPIGTPVRAPQVGVIKAVGFDPKLGKYVSIDHGAGTTTKYGHLSETLVREGQRVDQGQVFARTGNTGNSTGPHLHYGVFQGSKAVDPRTGRFGTDLYSVAERAEADASQEAQRLARNLEILTGRYDKAKAAADEYAITLAQITELERKGPKNGGISKEQAGEFRYQAHLQQIEALARAEAAKQQAFLDRIGAPDTLEPLTRGMEAAGRAGADAFRDQGIQAAQAIAQVIGGSVGGKVGSLLGLVDGAQTGNFNSVGGRLGGMLTLMGEQRTKLDRLLLPDGSQGAVLPNLNPNFADGFTDGMKGFSTDLKAQFGKIFGNTKLSEQFGQSLGTAFAGAQFGGAIGSAVTDVFGVKGSKMAAQLGGALGSAWGPLGSMIGGTLGSVVGGLMKKTPTGSATIGVGANGELVVTGLSGSSRKLRDAANDNAGGALTSIERIAEALGATVNAQLGSVSIGFRDKNARVDTSGRGITKTSKGAIDFGSDVEAAVKFATLDLIKDGILEGLRAGTQKLLQNAKDLEAGLDRALKFEGVFRDLKSIKDPVGAAIDDVDRMFKSLGKIFTEASASADELASLEELYGIRRKEAIEQATANTVGALRDFLRELTTGDNGKSLADRRTAALAQYNPLLGRVQAGDSTAFDDYAQAAQTLLQIQRQISGSGVDYFKLLDEMTRVTSAAIAGVENAASLRGSVLDPANRAGTSLTVDNSSVTSSIDRMADRISDNLSTLIGVNSAQNANLGAIISTLKTGTGTTVLVDERMNF